MKKADEDIIKAHNHSIHNRSEVEKSDLCGCFSCLAMFKPAMIGDYASFREDNDTPLCPFCGIDSVIGSASGFPITLDFLELMKKYWFKSVKVKGFEYKASRHIPEG